MLAVVLIPGLGVGAEADKALPKLIEAVVPTGLMGLIMAAMIASLMSSADSGLNSLATIVTNDFYHRWIERHASEARLILVGRVSSVAILVIAVTRALTMDESPSLMQFLQVGLAYIAAPVIVVFLGGLLWRGTTSAAAVTTLLAAPGVCLVSQNADTWISWWPTHVVYWLPLAVGILGTLLVGVSLFTRRRTEAELDGLIWTARSATSLEDGELGGAKPDPSAPVLEAADGRGIRDYRLWAALAIALMAAEIWWLW